MAPALPGSPCGPLAPDGVAKRSSPNPVSIQSEFRVVDVHGVTRNSKPQNWREKKHSGHQHTAGSTISAVSSVVASSRCSRVAELIGIAIIAIAVASECACVVANGNGATSKYTCRSKTHCQKHCEDLHDQEELNSNNISVVNRNFPNGFGVHITR